MYPIYDIAFLIGQQFGFFFGRLFGHLMYFMSLCSLDMNWKWNFAHSFIAIPTSMETDGSFLSLFWWLEKLLQGTWDQFMIYRWSETPLGSLTTSY